MRRKWPHYICSVNIVPRCIRDGTTHHLDTSVAMFAVFPRIQDEVVLPCPASLFDNTSRVDGFFFISAARAFCTGHTNEISV